MIPVAPQAEPESFDERVRQPGLRWLVANEVPLEARLEPGTKIHPYWREVMDDLHERYQGICAYLCVFVERCTGGVSTDHFVPKSRRAGLAYEWSNYRLACSTMNSRKRDFEDVLDPFTLTLDTFRLELVTGRIHPNPHLESDDAENARSTIDRLGLDDPICRQMRARRFLHYIERQISQEHLRRTSPLVWLEAHRQGLL